MDNGWVYPLAFVLSVYTLPPWGYNIPPPSHLIEERRLKSTGCKERDPHMYLRHSAGRVRYAQRFEAACSNGAKNAMGTLLMGVSRAITVEWTG